MRLIGKIEGEKKARLFSDLLTARRIENKLSVTNEEKWEIWVFDEDFVGSSKDFLQTFLQNPDNPMYEKEATQAVKVKKEKKKKANKRTQYIDARTQVFYRGLVRPGGLTMALIILSVGITVFSHLGENIQVIRWFLITDVGESGAYITWSKGFSEILHGQIWRLLTPIFVHFGILHILFNMLWLNDLGNLVESRKGTWFLVLFIAVTGISANIGQYLMSGPLFGGMSGVVYALLGYVWMKGKYEPLSQMALDKNTVTMMMIWFVLCFTGLLGPIANTAHTVGLLIGLAWGYLTSGHLQRYIQQRRFK